MQGPPAPQAEVAGTGQLNGAAPAALEARLAELERRVAALEAGAAAAASGVGGEL